MNNPNVVYHLFSGFKLNWNIDDLIKKFIEDQKNPINERLPYSHPSKKPHFQSYGEESGISFARNFHVAFKDECIDVIRQLKLIQQNINPTDSNSTLLKKFLEERFIFSKVNIIKANPNKKGLLHSDLTRSISLNIGLKNSNTHITYVSNELNINNFETSEKSKYILNNGDGYLVSVKHPHCLEPIIESDHPRYIITYTII